MIDFRYHLVSLVSVFLALAVGIVLGAGPLQGQITDGLTQRVNQLSDDKATLTTELRAAKAGTDNRDRFTREITPALVAGRLASRAVVVVTLPGADDGAVTAMTQTLLDAGATVTGRIDIKDAWVAPDTAKVRAALAEQWRSTLDGGFETLPGPSASPTASRSATAGARAGATTASATATRTAARTAAPSAPTAAPTASTTKATAARTAASSAAAAPSPTISPAAADLLLEAVLARAVLTPAASQAGREDATARSILDSLAKEGLLALNGDFIGRASEAVLIAPGVETATIAGVQQSASVSPSPDLTPTWTALSVALDAAGSGAVVVGPGSSAARGGVVAAVRAAGELTEDVSTVDTGGTPMGDVTTVLALREQLDGLAGAYGFGPAATAAIPGAAS